MLEVEKDGEDRTTRKQFSLSRQHSQNYFLKEDCKRGPAYLTSHNETPYEDTKHKCIVLEVDMIHNYKSGM